MENSWVDFKVVKAAVSIEQMMAHYGINWLKKKGDEHRGRCPIHKGESPDSFHVNFDKNCFQCFAGSCKKRGNVLDFVAAMEQCTIRDAALRLQEWFGISQKQSGKSTTEKNGTSASRVSVAIATPTTTDTRAAEKVGESDERNKPLNFQLKGVDPTHAYLETRGLDRSTIERFGVGFFPGKGSMNGRVVIPIHDEFGELVAYAGRSIDGSEPKYKLPVGFRKSQVLFNLARVKTGEWGSYLDGLVVVVEGFFDCMKVHQAGLPTVALMGCSLSEHQCRLITDNFVEVVVMLDGDQAGRDAALQIAGKLASIVWVRDVVLPPDRQPDQFSPDELNQLVDQVL